MRFGFPHLDRVERFRRRVRPRVERYFSPLTLRILAVNVIALAILVGSILYLGRYQDRLIEAELSALHLQARLSASALGEGAVVIDDEERNVLSPLLSRLMIRRMVEVTDTRTRLFDIEDDFTGTGRKDTNRGSPVFRGLVLLAEPMDHGGV